MKIIIPGGSGQVGTVLARAFHQRGDEVIVLSRTPAHQPWRVVFWDAETLGDWAQEVEGADAIINLAGRSVNCRYTPANRRSIIDSRLRSTMIVGEAIKQAVCPPPVWLQASTATLYAHRYDAPNDEVSGILGGSEPDLPDTWRFSLYVAHRWEKALEDAQTPRARKVALRSAMVMSPDPAGVFDTLLGLVRHGFGGPVGSGKQYVSWIHDQDFVQAMLWLIQHDALEGPVNISSPNPLPYAEFMCALRQGWGVGFGLPATEWMVESRVRPHFDHNLMWYVTNRTSAGDLGVYNDAVAQSDLTEYPAQSGAKRSLEITHGTSSGYPPGNHSRTGHPPGQCP